MVDIIREILNEEIQFNHKVESTFLNECDKKAMKEQLLSTTLYSRHM